MTTLQGESHSPTDRHYVVTGGSGFFGDYFVGQLLDQGAAVTNIDLVPSPRRHVRLRTIQADIGDRQFIEAAQRSQPDRTEGVFHLAAQLAHGPITLETMNRSNVDGTRNVLDLCRRLGTRQMVFISSNCIWSRPFGRPVREDDLPCPCEDYGKSKVEGERILLAQDDIAVGILRSPTIIQAGRLGLLAILFQFIDEGRKVWVVGDGSNRYQFVAAKDLADAALRAISLDASDTFNIGSAGVPTLRATFEHVIRESGSRSRVASMPRRPAIAAMRLAHLLHMSPLGPYHWRMISESFEFDIGKAKRMLDWKPTLGNNEILLEAYRYFAEEKANIVSRTNVSAHRKATPMGAAIELLRLVS